MKTKKHNIRDRVRENTHEEKNIVIDQQTQSNVREARDISESEITDRIEELRREWDIERLLEVNAASISLASMVLGVLADRRWFILSGVVAGFLLQHGIQGWCPPLNLFRSMGYRTRQEIDEEMYALKALRGDFDNISSSSQTREVLEGIQS